VFDDAPWAVVLVSVVAWVVLVASRFREVRGLKGALVAVTISTLLAFLPYVAFSGGGV
jgi:hypothetical protein